MQTGSLGCVWIDGRERATWRPREVIVKEDKAEEGLDYGAGAFVTQAELGRQVSLGVEGSLAM